MAHVTSIGLDVHARSIKGCAFNPFTGEVERKTFGYEPAEVASWILSFEAPKAVYESGVTGFHLQRELGSLGVDCVIGAVSKMDKPAADKRKKTDKRDAAFLARQLALGTVAEVHVPDPECEAGHDISRALADSRDDVVACKQRLAAKPRNAHILAPRCIEHALYQRNDIVLHFFRHLASAVIFEAIRAVEVATHGRTYGQADPVWHCASGAPHRFECRTLVELADDTALGEPLDNRMILIELFEDAEQVQLQRSVFRAISLEQIGDRHVLRVRHWRAQVVTRNMPPCLTGRATRLCFFFQFV